MTTIGDVHVGDIGTLYKAEIQDAGVAFDPSAATIKKLIWQTPGGVIERNATVTDNGLTGASQKWYLEYQLESGVDDNFHQYQGKYKWQGYVEFSNGHQYHTNIEEYVVERNLN